MAHYKLVCNLPFDFAVAGDDGLAPYHIDDFLNARYHHYIIKLNDMERIGGEPVEV